MDENDLIEEFEKNYDEDLIKLLEPIGLCHTARSKWDNLKNDFIPECAFKSEECAIKFSQDFGFKY